MEGKRFVTRWVSAVLIAAISVVASTKVATGASATDAPAAGPVVESSGPLRLADALALALERSPELEAFSLQVRASEAHELQARVFPNPELDVELEDVGGDGDFRGTRSAQTTVRLSQLIELGGERSSRKAVAAAMTEVAAREYEIERVEVLTDVAEKFVAVLAGQHEVALTEEATGLAEEALRAAKRRVEMGKSSALEEKKASIELARSRIDREHAEHELLVARKRLAATWASASPAFAHAEGDLFETHAIPSFGSLVERLRASPDLGRRLSERKLREAELALAKANRVPSIRLGAGIRRLEEPDDEVFVAQFSVPLPVFDRGAGSTAEARALRDKAEAEHTGATVRAEAALFGLYQEWKHAATALADLERVVVPQAKEALAISRTGYNEGRYAYLDLVDAQRTFVEVRSEAIATAVSLHTFLLGIERLTGEPAGAAR